jgi:arylsulfatase A-like enzyme
MMLDRSTGRILEELKRLGLDRRTLVVFTSDNGAFAKIADGGENNPLRGGKGSQFEGGYRVPCVVRWPGAIPAGQVSDQIATSMDIYPTFAALAGADLPDDRAIDGKNIWPLLSGEEGARSPHDAFFYYHRGMLRAVRSGNWKLQYGEAGKTWGLFNLEQDIGESQNLVRTHPEIVEKLLQITLPMRRELGDVLTGELGVGVRPVGRVTE